MFFRHPQARRTLSIVAGVACTFCATASGLVESTGPAGSNARSVHDAGLTGKGVHIAMLSSGNARSRHEAFEDADAQRAVTNHDFTGSGVSVTAHDTQVAGIVVSRGGREHQDCRGAAPGAHLHSARISDGNMSAMTLDRVLHDLIVNQHCRVVVTGVQMTGRSAQPNGLSLWSKLYDYYAEHYDIFFANAAGNGESAVTVFGDSYNGLTTGGLALDDEGRYRVVGSISNTGPTADGRRKPEVMAPAHRQMVPASSGDGLWAAAGSRRGETSFAAPHTAGIAALLMEQAADNKTPDGGRSLTIKAILANTADPDILNKAKDATESDASGWHPQRGYGLLDAGRASRLLEAGQIRPQTPVDSPAGWAYEMLGVYGRNAYRLVAKKGQRLTLTVTWHRRLIRYSPVSYVEEAPRFYVRIEILSPDGEILLSESDSGNNLRKIDIPLPKDGDYTIVLGNPVYQQDRAYAMAFELHGPNPCADPPK